MSMDFFAIGLKYEKNTFWDFKQNNFVNHLTPGCLLPEKELCRNVAYSIFDYEDIEIIELNAYCKEGKMLFKIKKGEFW